jgi:hypothetical protein
MAGRVCAGLRAGKKQESKIVHRPSHEAVIVGVPLMSVRVVGLAYVHHVPSSAIIMSNRCMAVQVYGSWY